MSLSTWAGGSSNKAVIRLAVTVFYIILSVSMLLNIVTLGRPGESFSSRSYRDATRADWLLTRVCFCVIRRVIDVAFLPLDGWDHCRHAFADYEAGQGWVPEGRSGAVG